MKTRKTTPDKLETRLAEVNLERRDDGEVGAITGYAAVFNKSSEDMGFIEEISPGAFKKALKVSDVRALKNHDPNWIFGRTGVNLELKEDKRGLFMRASRPKPMTDTFRSVAQDIEAGLITQQSFGFTVAREEWDKDYRKRKILEVDRLYDVSAVTYPAYPDTTVALRSREKAMEQHTDVETIRVADGDAVFEFADIAQFERVSAKIKETAVANNAPEEETDGDAESRHDDGTGDVANNEKAPTTVNQNKRFQEMKSRLKVKGFKQ